MSFAVLGPANGAAVITFEVSSDKVLTWETASRSGGARWAIHQIFGKKPLREFIGPGLDSIELPIRLDKARGVIPRDELRKLRKQRDEGNVLQFTIGDQLVGDWVVEDIQETWTRFDKKGVLLVAEVRLSLGEYQ
jgi:phage protein U